MSDKTTHPLKFICQRCYKESTYPTYLTESQDEDETQIVIKHCTNCGGLNALEIPEGYKSEAETEVLRGLEND